MVKLINNKLKLNANPYTYVRVAVMKGELIKPEEWNQLVKMGLNELLRMLQDGRYKKEIDELGLKKGLPDIEQALNNNMMRNFSKLKRISDEKLREVLEIYLYRYDIENFKTIIHGKASGASRDDISSLLIPSANHTQEFTDALLARDSLKEIVGMLPVSLKYSEDAFELVNSLDRNYFEQIMSLSGRLSWQGNALKEFIMTEMEIVNINIILRMKKQKAGENEIKSFLIRPTSRIIGLSGKESVKEIIDLLYSMKFLSFGSENMSESTMCERAELELTTFLLKREISLMHRHMLTVNFILGYMFAKEIEVRNLKMLLKGKKLGLEQNLIEKLVVAG